MTQPHDHDGGLTADLKAILARRSVLAGLGVMGAGIAVYAVLGTRGEATVTGQGPDGAICVADPVETNGPFPADGTNAKDGQTVNVLTESGVVRQDIRPSFAGQTPVAEGVAMDMVIRLVSVSGACAPLAGHAVYVWQCDAAGQYSIYNAADRNYLRGVGITDATGEVRFTSIVPACYDGRWPHVHFEVFASAEAAVSGDDSLLISQFALPQDMVAAVYASDARYAGSVENLADVSLAGDMVFGDNTPEQIAVQTLTVTGDPAAGYVASGLIGIL
ncbi:MAG: intradiol ring-cleavage dioxygenase [Pseudomonadota bacterium]